MNSKKSWLLILIGVVGLAGVLALAIILNNNTATKETDGADSELQNALDIDNGDLKIDWSRYSKYDINLSSTATIVKAGVYHVTGELEDAPLIINAGTDKVRLILDNVTIKNSTGPAIVCYAADDLVIELVGENILRDGNKYSENYDEDVKGAIYSKADLTFEGSGALTVAANYQDGIVGKDDVKFSSGNYIITAADDAIRGKDSVYIVNGDFNLTSRSDGIKSTNETTTGKGFVLIENGHIKIAAGDDAIHAEKSLYVYNGNIDITKSYEGLEAPVVTINGGEIAIVSSDDGINAAGATTTQAVTEASNTPRNMGPGGQGGGMMDTDENSIITINGGNVYVNASGDGVDSNGYVYINGGTLIVDGPTNNGNGALDAGLGIIAKGGTLLAVGASGMAEAPTANSTQYSASIFFDTTYPAGTKIKIKNMDGETIIRHTSAKTFNHMTVSIPEFVLGEIYDIYINDTEYDSFTVSDTVTVVGNSNNAFPGAGGNPGDNPGGNPGDNPAAGGDPGGQMPPDERL